MSRILITGGSSYLGRHFVPVAKQAHQVAYTYFQNDPLQDECGYQVDLRQETAVINLVQSWQPETIIHLAGSNRGPDMGEVIRLGTSHITKAAQAIGARLIHFSTDSIFRGDKAPYDETAVPDPVNEYGFAKSDAERAVQTHPNYVIMRTSLIYSLQEMDHGTHWMSKALKAGQDVTLFNNQIRNPVWVNTLISATLELMPHPYIGILNIAGSQSLTRAEFSLRMLDWWKIKERHTLHIAPSQNGLWPLDCQLDLRRAKSILNTTLLGVDDVLAQHSE